MKLINKIISINIDIISSHLNIVFINLYATYSPKIVATKNDAISIIAMIALGIKYMMGSVEEKAEYKKTLLPYFIGAAFVFGATAIPQVIYNMFK